LGNTGKVKWSPFNMGCFAGIIPWAVILAYLIKGSEGVPEFVWVIFVNN
jgi:hypothetical protein